MADSWDDALGQELRLQDMESRDIEECDWLRTPSTPGEGNAEGLQASPETPKSPSTWWAVVLQVAGRSLGLPEISASQSGRVNIVSACSGCSAESWVCKARKNLVLSAGAQPSCCDC